MMGAMTAVGERELGPAFGLRLKDARERAGLSQREAAKKAGISVFLWNALERNFYMRDGVRKPVNPSAENILKAATAVGLDRAEALRLAGIEASSQLDQYLPVPDITPAEISSKAARLTKTQRRAVNDLIDAMLYPHGRDHVEIASGPEETAVTGIQSGPLESAVGTHPDEDVDQLGSR